MKVKEESEKAGLKLNIQKTKIMASGTILSWQIEVGKLEAMTDFVLLAPKLCLHVFPHHQNHIYVDPPPASLERFLRAI